MYWHWNMYMVSRSLWSVHSWQTKKFMQKKKALILWRDIMRAINSELVPIWRHESTVLIKRSKKFQGHRRRTRCETLHGRNLSAIEMYKMLVTYDTSSRQGELSSMACVDILKSKCSENRDVRWHGEAWSLPSHSIQTRIAFVKIPYSIKLYYLSVRQQIVQMTFIIIATWWFGFGMSFKEDLDIVKQVR